MNKTLSSILLTFGICVSSLATDKNRTVSFPRCEGQESSAVAASVKRDYLQKQVLHW
ncbi:TPA: YebF family protein, partial [Escherichia coli]